MYAIGGEHTKTRLGSFEGGETVAGEMDSEGLRVCLRRPVQWALQLLAVDDGHVFRRGGGSALGVVRRPVKVRVRAGGNWTVCVLYSSPEDESVGDEAASG